MSGRKAKTLSTSVRRNSVSELNAGGENCCVEIEPMVLVAPVLKILRPSWLMADLFTSANFTSNRTSPGAGGSGTCKRLMALGEAAETSWKIRSATPLEGAWPGDTQTAL